MTRIVFSSLGFALALVLCAAPLSDAFAGQTVVIDNDVTGDVVGNSPKSDHTWDDGVDDPADLLDANGNKVTVNSDVTGEVRGGYAESTNSSATGNSVTINGGTVDDDVTGGYAQSGSGSATATGNSMTINGGSVGRNVYGGRANDGSGSATGNSVTINGGSVGRNVYGGSTNSGSATGNSVTINGGEVTGDVRGGDAGSNAATATATHNTVTISGSPVFDSSHSSLFGGGVSSGGNPFTGNTLNVWNYTGTAVYSVQNFQNYNFVLPASLQGLEIDVDKAYLSDGNGTGSAVTGVSTLGGAAPVPPGDELVTLISGPTDPTGFTQTKAQGKHGATLLYDWTLRATDDGLFATLDSVQAHPHAKALSEGFLGGLALTTQGADLVAGQGMGNAVSAAHGAGGSGFGAFAALSGGSMRYNTGSHVDMNSVSLMTGLAWGVDATPGRLTLGAFLEYGTGSYDTHNSFSNAASVDGDGDAWYLGGGVLGRMDFQNTGPGRFYAEASARIGRAHNEYGSSDLRDGMGRSAGGYDSSSLYYGLHFGTGYLWNITDKASLDLYGKYFWTRQQGDSVTLSTNDPVTFKDADSSRLRLGTRFAYTMNETVSPYIGAAYEHEFDGKARASTYGYSIDAPSLRGDTGIGEIGLTLKPSPTKPLSFDVGVQGYTGKREGVTGSLQMKYEF